MILPGLTSFDRQTLLKAIIAALVLKKQKLAAYPSFYA
ncbi:hypothetical protein EPYR_02390 [Erwinia pyrifoliae DSM 12163]|nr:hypothetical protein EPYR_02390 [Erwinia pyrifoliae DSM 12163]